MPTLAPDPPVIPRQMLLPIPDPLLHPSAALATGASSSFSSPSPHLLPFLPPPPLLLCSNRTTLSCLLLARGKVKNQVGIRERKGTSLTQVSVATSGLGPKVSIWVCSCLGAHCWKKTESPQSPTPVSTHRKMIAQ